MYNAHAMMPYPAVKLPYQADGPLAGLTFAVKDLFDVAGYPTSGGNPQILAMSGIKTQTAPIVQQLLDAGARCIGKTQTNEMAFSMSGHNAHFGTPINGAAPDRIPGGSSSGSASAVSNQLCDFALGTDTGGSIRTPASYCNLFGLRPTHGRLSLENCQPLCPSMDTCGFFAKDPAIFTRVGQVLLGQDNKTVNTDSLLLAKPLFDLLSPESQEAFQPAINQIRQTVNEVITLETLLPDIEQAYWDFRYIQGYEAWQAQGRNITKNHLILGPDVASRFHWSSKISEARYLESCANRKIFRDQWQQLLQSRILILPTVPNAAPLLNSDDEKIEEERQIAHRILDIAVLCQWPQVNIPLASIDGAPLGISLMGPAGSDLTLIKLAEKIYSTNKV